MQNKIPERMCLGCGQMKAKTELVRIIRTQADDFLIDHSQKADGRGAYVCRDAACISTVLKRKSLERALKCHPGTEKMEAFTEELIRIYG